MKGKYRTQAIPHRSSAASQAPHETTGLNPGKAGPKGALEERPPGGPPSSGAPTNEGNNTRRDYVNGPAKRGHR
jgi:hypothetical protein